MRAIGLLGGSFDPVHVAHLAMADAFATALALDELRFLPASRPWQKTGLLASATERREMLEIALATHAAPTGRYVIDARELQRAGPTFTLDTLRDVRAEVGDDVSLVFLFGADQLLHLDTWKGWTALWSFAHLAAVTRPGFGIERCPSVVAGEWTRRLGTARDLHDAASGRSFWLEGLDMDVAATDIRNALAGATADERGGLDRLVPSAVLDYIQAHHLYRS